MAEGWQPRRCTCGHIEADHKSTGRGFVRPVGRGICLIKGCACRHFLERKEA